jgi:hypothetical protein
MFGPRGPFCQSCGMPLSKDERGGGTEANGALSTEYCSHCYLDGHFTAPEMTAGEMAARVAGRMKEMGIPGFIARGFTKRIPELRRWKPGAAR